MLFFLFFGDEIPSHAGDLVMITIFLCVWKSDRHPWNIIIYNLYTYMYIYTSYIMLYHVNWNQHFMFWNEKTLKIKQPQASFGGSALFFHGQKGTTIATFPITNSTADQIASAWNQLLNQYQMYVGSIWICLNMYLYDTNTNDTISYYLLILVSLVCPEVLVVGFSESYVFRIFFKVLRVLVEKIE